MSNLRPLHGALGGSELVRIDWNSFATWLPSWGTAPSCLGASASIPRRPGRRVLRALLRRPAFLAHLYHPSLGGGQSNPHQFAAAGACSEGLLSGALPSDLLHLALYHGCSPPTDVFGLCPSQRRPSWSPLGYPQAQGIPSDGAISPAGPARRLASDAHAGAAIQSARVAAVVQDRAVGWAAGMRRRRPCVPAI